MDNFENLSSAWTKFFNQDVEDIKFIDPHGLPTEEDWNALKERIENEVNGYSEVIIDTDSFNFYYSRVRFNTDERISDEFLSKIELDGITTIENYGKYIDVVIDFCPKCTEDTIKQGIRALNKIPYLIKHFKTLGQFMGEKCI